ncbi:protein Mlp2p [Monosporozyma servazzii]
MDSQLDTQKLNLIPGFNSLSVYLQQHIQQFIIDQFDHLNNTTIIPLKDENTVLKSTEQQYNNIISDLRVANENLSEELQSINTTFDKYKIESNDKISLLNNDNIVLHNQLNLINVDLKKRQDEIIELNKLKQNHFNQVQNLQNNIDTNQQNYEKDLALQEKLITTQNQQLNLLQTQLKKINNNNISTLLMENERLNKVVQTDDKASILNNEIQKLETQLSAEKQSKKNLQTQLEQYINELESKLPLVESYKSKINGLNDELIQSKNILSETRIEIDELKQANLDLSHQLQYLLITLNIQSNPHQKLLSNKQLLFLQSLLSSTNTMTTSQDIITDELVEFNDIINLQQLNAKLLKIVRSLSQKLEQTESQYSINNENNLTIINDAKNALETLETYSTDLESKISELTTELDSYKNKSKQQNNSEPSLTLNEQLQKIKMLQDKINNLTTINNELVLKFEQSTLSNELYQKRIEMVESLLSNEQNLNQNHQSRYNNLRTELEQRDTEINNLNDKLFKSDKDLTRTKIDLDLQNIKLHQKNIELIAIKGRDEEANKIIKTKESKLVSLKSQLSENELAIKNLNLKVNELEAINKALNDLATSKNSFITKQIENDSINLKWYENKVDLLKIEKSKLIKIITQKDQDIQSLNNTITTLHEKISNIESIHEMNERTVREENINWNQQLSNYKQQLSTTTIALNSLKQSNIESETLITDLNNQLNMIRNEYDEKLLSLNNELVDKIQSLQSLQTSNDNLISTKKSLENQNNELSLNVVNLTKSNQESLNIIESNKLEIASLTAQIQSLEQTINDYKSKLLQSKNTTTEFSIKEHEAGSNISDLQKLRDEKEAIWNQLILSQHEEVLLRNTLTEIRKQVASLTSEIEFLKRTRERSPDLFDSSSEISELLTQVEEYKTKNIDAEDRFSRLKKQAHDKLKYSKDLANSLTTENESLKTLNQQLNNSLKTSEEKIQNLESIVRDREQNQVSITSLQQELSAVLEQSKDIEGKLKETIKNSHSVIQDLNEEIDSLKKELSVLKNNNPLKLDDLSKTVESMKKSFEEEKIQFIEKTRKEFEEKITQKETISSTKAHGFEEIEKIKKELEDKIAQETEAKLQALKKENEDELQKIKSKAFEEGKQQASMKTNLLERKISKLESELKDTYHAKETSDIPSQSMQDIKTPDTAPVGKSSPFGSTNSTYNKLTFPFQSSAASLNPFTSPLDKNVFMTSSNNVSTLKPTFSLHLSNRTASDIDTSEMTRDSSSEESNVSSLKRSATEELAGNSINKKVKEDGSINEEFDGKEEDTS